MEKIWYRNPSKSEVIGRCGGDEKTIDHAEQTTVERKKTQNKNKKSKGFRMHSSLYCARKIKVLRKCCGKAVPDFNRTDLFSIGKHIFSTIVKVCSKKETIIKL